jgi:hypothetical protein
LLFVKINVLYHWRRFAVLNDCQALDCFTILYCCRDNLVNIFGTLSAQPAHGRTSLYIRSRQREPAYQEKDSATSL